MDAMKLLIADGNEEFRRALAAELQGAYHVRCCGDGKEALSLLRSFVPDVLVCTGCTDFGTVRHEVVISRSYIVLR